MLTLFMSLAFANPSSWEDTIDRVSPSIVSIQVSSNRFFDTETMSSSVATGFVVDAERGIILTNRHVVEPGPVTAQAVLLNSEEIPLKPIYRDPIHDFGFYQYDPDDVRFLDLVPLELCVDCAQVGLDVRLIGNDAGEKISILEATLARLDRQAPNYGRGRFNDFNTFYFQAAAGSSGGSSGSPVLNQQGQVVALNAGGRSTAASSFFLPLNRVARALELVQQEQPITRGGLLGTFERTPFPEAIRLGLSEVEEVAFRREFPNRDGVLVITQIVPGGPLSDIAKVGDVLLSINGQRLSDFVTLDAILDDNVGEAISVRLQRAGEIVEHSVTVADLHAVTPFISIQGCQGSFNDMSYQIARHYTIPITGVTVAFGGYCFSNAGVNRGSVITAIDDQPIQNVQDLWNVLTRLDDGDQFEVTYFSLQESQLLQRSIVEWNRTWFPLEQWTRNDQTGVWDIQVAPSETSAAEQTVVPAPSYAFQKTMWGKKDKWGSLAQRALVTVRFSIPLSVQGVYGSAFFGAGIIVDAAEGIVAVDRDTVPIALGDLEVIFAGEVRLPAKVVWVHPEHSVTLIQYDVLKIPNGGQTAVRFVPEPPEEPFFEDDQKVFVYGLDYDYVLHGSPNQLEQDRFLEMPNPRQPFFRESNLEVGVLKEPKDLVGGMVLTKKGEMLGQWASFPDLRSSEQKRALYVMPSYVIQESLEAFRSQRGIQTLGVEFHPLNWIEAAEFGLTTAMINQVEGSGTPERWYSVQRIAPDSPASTKLRTGDIVLAVDGRLVTHFRMIERQTREAETVELTVLRQGEIHSILVQTVTLPSQSVTQVLSWGGALIHEVPWAASMQTGASRQGAYVAWCYAGAPCRRDGLNPQRRIISANQQPVGSLEDLMRIVQDPSLPSEVRIEAVSLKGRPETIVLRRDETYWKTEWLEWQQDTKQWSRYELRAE